LEIDQSVRSGRVYEGQPVIKKGRWYINMRGLLLKEGRRV